jgi:hypothetical protein
MVVMLALKGETRKWGDQEIDEERMEEEGSLCARGKGPF